jgi:hypothetical protein
MQLFDSLCSSPYCFPLTHVTRPQRPRGLTDPDLYLNLGSRVALRIFPASSNLDGIRAH